MHLKLDSASLVKRSTTIKYTLHPLNVKGELCRTTYQQRTELQALLPRIQAMAQTHLSEWFHTIEYNSYTKTLDLYFSRGISSHVNARRRFVEFKGWLAIFSEETAHTNEAQYR